MFDEWHSEKLIEPCGIDVFSEPAEARVSVRVHAFKRIEKENFYYARFQGMILAGDIKYL